MTCSTKIEILAAQILQKLSISSVWRVKFLLRLFALWPALLGRYNFVNLGRQGEYIEYTYRKHFSKRFDWLDFNLELMKLHVGPRRIICLDPSFMNKAGKCTPGLGYFHSGKESRRKWGIEITGLAAVDLDNKTAYHLEAVQTVDRQDGESLLSYYARIIEQRACQLKQVSEYVVADAYFSRNPFIPRVVNAGFHVISRARKNVSLRYYYTGPKKGKGRNRKYNGKVDLFQPNLCVFSVVPDLCTDKQKVYAGIVELKSVKIPVKAILVHELDAQGQVEAVRTYICTDTTLSAHQVLQKYTHRYQQEFIFRDSKQFTGLEQGQSRDINKIHFHINTAMTVVNLAKAAHFLDQPVEYRRSFSMSDIKMAYANERLALHIFRRCGLDPNKPKMKTILEEVKKYGARAA